MAPKMCSTTLEQQVITTTPASEADHQVYLQADKNVAEFQFSNDNNESVFPHEMNSDDSMDIDRNDDGATQDSNTLNMDENAGGCDVIAQADDEESSSSDPDNDFSDDIPLLMPSSIWHWQRTIVI